MADIRCPMCSKPNPEDAEVCQYCQARLKPLVVSSASGPGGSIPPKKPPVSPAKAEHDSALPDWLDRIRSEDENVTEPEEAEAGSAFQPEEAIYGDDKPQPVGKAESSDLPDWLASLGASGTITEPPSEEEKKPAELPAEKNEDEPDWLERIRARQETEGNEPPLGVFITDIPSEPVSSENTHLPNWISSLPEQESAPPPFHEETPVQSTEQPDWLSRLDTGPSPEPGVQPFSNEPEMPDWLSRLSGQEAGGLPEPTQVEPLDARSYQQQPGEEIPDWLSKLESSSAEKDQLPALPALILNDETEDHDILKTEAPAAEGTPDLNALPDWIFNVTAEEPSAGGPSSAEAESEAGLEPAQLPSWLEAMRPIEAAAPLVSSQEDLSAAVEKGGPLAGLRGVLPIDPNISRLRKPSAYSIKLQVPEDQQALVKRLEDLIATEADARSQPRKQSISSQSLLRMFVAIVLFLGILAPMLYDRMYTDQKLLELPGVERITKDISDTNFSLGTLPVGAPVLLAFDYQPGVSAEIEAASAAILDQLISRAAFLTMVSTKPTGPVLGERVLQGINSKRASPYTNYTNLGFIPGGESGLIGFAERPRQVMPYNLKSQEAWSSGPPAGIHKISDFSLVLVFTENSETARSWIEQVQPFLAAQKRPLIMVVSAQVEPLIRPYYEANPKQVNGMVAGLAGGAAYESLTGHPSVARDYWDAFGGGMMAASILILAGMLIYGGIGLFSPVKRAEGEAAK